jgi:hypothetical protein
MLEPTQIPLLLKVLDFLFEEGHIILDELRKKRQSSRKGAQPAEAEAPAPAAPAAAPAQEFLPATAPLEAEPVQGEGMATALTSKDDFLQHKVARQLWAEYEKEIDHQLHLMQIYARNYRLAQEQIAKWGEALAPQILMHNRLEAVRGLETCYTELQKTLSDVYGQPVALLAEDTTRPE